MTPFPFVVGCGRSGTTLVRAILDSHPDLCVAPESHFITGFYRRLPMFETGAGLDTEKLLTMLMQRDWYRRWDLHDEVVWDAYAEQRPADFASLVRLVFATYAKLQGKPRYADKTPPYVQHIPLLASLFPESRFVHIIRDGRDVALSFVDQPFGPASVVEAAMMWDQRVRAGRTGGTLLGSDRYMEVRYEDLVAEPQAAAERIAAFVEVPFDDGMLRYFERADQVVRATVHSASHTNVSRPPTKGLRDWRTKMSTRDRQFFDVVAGDLLDELGYERGVRAVSLPRRIDARARRWGVKTKQGLIGTRIDVRRGVRSSREPASANSDLT